MELLYCKNLAKSQHKKSLSEVIESLRQQRRWLYEQKIDQLIDFFSVWLKAWPRIGLDKKAIYRRGLEEFLEPTRLKEVLDLSLHGDRRSLDAFCDLKDRKLRYRAQARGLAVHWLAGNVPVSGVYSILAALLTKNVSLAKVSAQAGSEVIDLVSSWERIETRHIKGRELTRCIVLAHLDRDDPAQNDLSLAADVRLIWGSLEAADRIIRLPKSVYAEDVVMGPKNSYSYIDASALNRRLRQAVLDLAIDISVFDQMACSSPRLILLKENARLKTKDLAHILGKSMEEIKNNILPVNRADEQTAYQICKWRQYYGAENDIIASQGTDWTIIAVSGNKKRLVWPEGCSSRTVMIMPVKNINDAEALHARNLQTVCLGPGNKTKILKDLDRLTRMGGDRCPDLGYSSFFEMPWDGMFVFDRLVRWVSVYK